jgi:hypothetical protein
MRNTTLQVALLLLGLVALMDRLPTLSAAERLPGAGGGEAGAGRLPQARYVLMGVDCFGELAPRSCQELQEIAGLEPGQALPFGWTGGDAAQQLQRSGPYASATLSPVFYPDGSAYVTIDVVAIDQAATSPLLTSPSRELALSLDLLDLYADFQQLWMDLFSRGAAVAHAVEDGHWSFRDARLRPYTSLFRQEVPRHRQHLIEVLRGDARPAHRQRAAGLLGFDQPDASTRAALSLAMRDGAQSVRSEAARALLPRASLPDPTGALPAELDPALLMLSLPSSADRSNASALLAELALQPALRQRILAQSAPTLLQMLDARRPGARSQALEVLQRATGRRDIGPDPQRWRQHLQM